MNKRWLIHTVSVETFLGAGAYGDTFATPTDDVGYLEGSVKLVRDQTGQQVVSSSTWYTALANAPKYTPDSRFTDPDGKVSRVVGTNTYQTPLGVEDHVEVYLT
jgi:hypothetical protein